MEGQRAGDVFEAQLDAKRPAAGICGVVFALTSLVNTLSFGYTTGVPADLVVRRRSDGDEVLRTNADADEAAGQLLIDVRGQLDRLTVAEFCERWAIEGPT